MSIIIIHQLLLIFNEAVLYVYRPCEFFFHVDMYVDNKASMVLSVTYVTVEKKYFIRDFNLNGSQNTLLPRHHLDDSACSQYSRSFSRSRTTS